MVELLVRLALVLLWLLHFLPLSWQTRLARGLGMLLFWLGRDRRRIARRNLELCFPDKPLVEREALLREHFKLLARSLLERGLLWHASPERLKRLIHVEGDVGLADRGGRPVMWLVPHFVGLEVAGVAVQLFQKTLGIDIYRQQRSPAFDAALKKGRLRFGGGEAFPRTVSIRVLMKRIREGRAFFNMPDQDFGPKDSAFVPFFGVDTCTLLAPSRMAKLMNMAVQPVLVSILPGGQGWRVRFLDPLPGWPTDDPLADTVALNRLIEQWVLEQPAQYLWVHKRFKTVPPGQADRYTGKPAGAPVADED
jgi:Kdo2-lipid IVA lauroyltransferase/acyltransferase